MSDNYADIFNNEIISLNELECWSFIESTNSQVRASFISSHRVHQDVILQFEVLDARVTVSWDISKLGLESAKSELVDAIAMSFLTQKNFAKTKKYILELWNSDRTSILGGQKIERALADSKFCIELATFPTFTEDPKTTAKQCYQMLSFWDGWIIDIYQFIQNKTELIPDIEGTASQSLQTIYERSKLNRKIAIEIHGLDCSICQFSFIKKYGELGKNFIHVHHIERLADSKTRLIDPEKDLITLCPNCHAMLHRETPPILPEKLKALLSFRFAGLGDSDE